MTCQLCARNDCIVRPEDHGKCVAAQIPGHDCRGAILTAQHRPKKGMGGNNPKSRVVAFLDALLHDAIDNGFKYQGRRWSDAAPDHEFYALYDRTTGERLVRVPLEGERHE